MNREIICLDCAKRMRPSLCAADEAAGFHRRVVEIVARKPDGHKITVLAGNDLGDLKVEKVTALPSLMCDRCGEPIPDGAPCKAVTVWRGPEPEMWEHEFNQPL
ncbi:MAG: hypothetical protein KGL39_02680 [Patescibacteria group bacterium]|nr:hypothetical protein [Patescibacteria group bacterium]